MNANRNNYTYLMIKKNLLLVCLNLGDFKKISELDLSNFSEIVIASDNIKVHKEQNPKMSYYFDPKNPNELSKKIYQVSKIRSNKFKKFDFIKKNYINNENISTSSI